MLNRDTFTTPPARLQAVLTPAQRVDRIVALQAEMDSHLDYLTNNAIQDLSEHQYCAVSNAANSTATTAFMVAFCEYFYGPTAERRALGIPE